MKYTGERMIPEHNQKEEIYLEHMSRYVFAAQFVEDKKVLDIACGSGYGSSLLKKVGAKEVIGVDISKETVRYCEEKYKEEKIRFIVGSVERIPVGDNSVDVIVSFETIEHVSREKQFKFIKEVQRVLKKDGVFVVSTPNALVYPKGNPFHVYELNPDEFVKALKNSFSDVSLCFQDNAESSFVLPESCLSTNTVRYGNKNCVFGKFNDVRGYESMYLVAVCKNGGVLPVSPCITMTNIKTSPSSNMSIALEQKERELQLIKSSKFWKMREIYLKIKFAVFSPHKFVRKYLILSKKDRII